MNALIVDPSGDFDREAFYEIEVPLEIDTELLDKARRHGWIVSEPPKQKQLHVRLEVWISRSNRFGCPHDPTHVTGHDTESFSGHLFGKGPCYEIVPDVVGQSVVVRPELQAKLERCGFLGVKIDKLTIHMNQSNMECPELYRLQFDGVKIQRKGQLLDAEANYCPFCNFAPIVCSGCGDVAYSCRNCEEQVIVNIKRHSGPLDRRWTTEGRPDRGWILNGANWDGSDFIKSGAQGLVSKRVVDFLLAARAAPFVAKPCQFDLTNMTDAQLAALKRAKTQVG